MPIQTARQISRIDEQDFYKIDHQMMRFAFDIHNEIGRLWDEKIYRNELANRCRKAGSLMSRPKCRSWFCIKTLSKNILLIC